ncbi:hypothetical protein [Sphaerisporangium sp. NPDC051011]|uniref:hypothetical protein n=1 Tax=Sphaerisporangium sp. NPDC051011 TaxID=3155792 RepID=UPI0033E490B2
MRTGRHGRGQAGVQAVRRRDWDPEARAAARLLDGCEPAWTILYGVWSRRYYAIPNWRTAEPLLVESSVLADLRRQMREVEASNPTLYARSSAT